jgi:hypothetical protein
MNTSISIDWSAEQDRFQRVAYSVAMRAALRAFKHFPPQKQEDAVAEFMGKLWDQWVRYRQSGKDPSTMVFQFIHWAKKWVSYDRKIARRAPMFDVQDYRAHMVDNTINRHGELRPRDRSARTNAFINWIRSHRETDPAVLASALETANVSLSQWYDLSALTTDKPFPFAGRAFFCAPS